MEAKAKAGEEDLSMEEILQSIRKIIAEDGEEAPASAANGNASVASSDVLELSDMVEEAPAAAEVPAPASAQDAVNDILNTLDQAVVPEAPAAPPPAAPAAPAPQAVSPAITPSDQAYIDSLLSSEAASAAATAFKKALPMDTPIRTTPSMPLRGGNTVEDLLDPALLADPRPGEPGALYRLAVQLSYDRRIGGIRGLGTKLYEPQPVAKDPLVRALHDLTVAAGKPRSSIQRTPAANAPW